MGSNHLKSVSFFSFLLGEYMTYMQSSLKFLQKLQGYASSRLIDQISRVVEHDLYTLMDGVFWQTLRMPTLT